MNSTRGITREEKEVPIYLARKEYYKIVKTEVQRTFIYKIVAKTRRAGA